MKVKDEDLDQRQLLDTIRRAFRKSVVPTLKKLLWERTKEDMDGQSGGKHGAGQSDARQSLGDRQLS